MTINYNVERMSYIVELPAEHVGGSPRDRVRHGAAQGEIIQAAVDRLNEYAPKTLHLGDFVVFEFEGRTVHGLVDSYSDDGIARVKVLQ